VNTCNRTGWRAGLGLAAVATLLAGCVTEPLAVRRVSEPAPEPDTRVYVYPAAGQSGAQLDRDRYECHLWAVKQSGFDPSSTQLPPHQRVEVVSAAPPGTGTAVGAITGAVIGSAVSRPREAGAGALFGAVAGAIVGAASDQAREDQARQTEARLNAGSERWSADQGRRAEDYRRALTACLSGRSYTVK
jgi:hypothetical protein